MIAFYIILAASPVLLLCAVVFLAVIVVGIRRGDRGDLRLPASDRIDAITRRVAGVGVRNDAGNEEEDES
jgi:hypothetical protein